MTSTPRIARAEVTARLTSRMKLGRRVQSWDELDTAATLTWT